ncbi:MAG: hypothetical protein ACHQQR_04610 [Gemmatimonadales bacterium]
MTPLAIGALLAVAAMVWVIAPIFGERPDDGTRDVAPSPATDDAAERAIRRFREPKE